MLDSNISKLGYDISFSLDNFGKPRIISEIELIKNIVLFILFSKPGQYPSLPNIGLNIQSYLYSFYDEIDSNGLRDQIISQCNALGAYFDRGVINIVKTLYRNKPSLMIHIEGTSTFPQNYNIDDDSSKKYLIGITYDELNQMIYNISEKGE